jgi:hypothetical protein
LLFHELISFAARKISGTWPLAWLSQNALSLDEEMPFPSLALRRTAYGRARRNPTAARPVCRACIKEKDDVLLASAGSIRVRIGENEYRGHISCFPHVASSKTQTRHHAVMEWPDYIKLPYKGQNSGSERLAGFVVFLANPLLQLANGGVTVGQIVGRLASFFRAVSPACRRGPKP